MAETDPKQSKSAEDEAKKKAAAAAQMSGTASPGKGPTLNEHLQAHLTWIESQMKESSEAKEDKQPDKQKSETASNEGAPKAEALPPNQKLRYLIDEFLTPITRGLSEITFSEAVEEGTQERLKKMKARERKQKKQRRSDYGAHIERKILETADSERELETMEISWVVYEAKKEAYLMLQSDEALKDFIVTNSLADDSFCKDLPEKGTFRDGFLERIKSIIRDSMKAAEFEGLVEQLELVCRRGETKPAPERPKTRVEPPEPEKPDHEGITGARNRVPYNDKDPNYMSNKEAIEKANKVGQEHDIHDLKKMGYDQIKKLVRRPYANIRFMSRKASKGLKPGGRIHKEDWTKFLKNEVVKAERFDKSVDARAKEIQDTLEQL